MLFRSEQFGNVEHTWIYLWGMLRDEMFRWAQFVVQHGFLYLWDNIDLRVQEFMHREAEKLYNENGAEINIDPTPVSLDFEVIKIFKVWACLLVLGGLVFLYEIRKHILLAWDLCQIRLLACKAKNNQMDKELATWTNKRLSKSTANWTNSESSVIALIRARPSKRRGGFRHQMGGTV